MKNDLRNMTVLIPVRIDSMIRLENLLAVVEYLLAYYEVNIMVSEAASYNNHVLQRLLPSSVQYSFVKDNDPVYYRTKYINEMMKTVQTDFVAVWDADVILPVRQVIESFQLLEKHLYNVVYPYNGTFYDTSIAIRQMYIETPHITLLEELAPMMSSLYGKGSFGGVFMIDSKKYTMSGMENLAFYGWGAEDWERYERWKNLGYRIGRVQGDLYHLWHPRDMNGKYNSDRQRRYSNQESLRSKFSSAEEIKTRMGLL